MNPAPQPKVEPEADERAEPNLFLTSSVSARLPVVGRQERSPEPSPSPSASFLGQPGGPQLGLTKPESPPDTSGAVGRDKLMVTLNSNYVIQRKSDGADLSTVSITSFWSAVGARDPFDPHVLYDPYSDRWLVSAADDPLLGDLDHLLRDLGHGRSAGQLASVRDRRRSRPTRPGPTIPTIGFSRGSVAIGVNMFATGTLTYVRGRVIALDYDALRAGRSRQSGRHQRPGRLRAPARDHEFADREDAVRGRARREHGRDLPAVVARRQDADTRRRRGQGESARGLDVARAGERPAATGRPGNRHGRLADRQRRLPQRSHLLRADVRDAGRRPRRLRSPLRRPVGRDRHERQLRPGRADRGRVGEPLERRPFVRVRDARGELPQRRARRVLGVPVRRLRRRGVRVPGGYRSAEHDPRPRHLQGRGGALRQEARPDGTAGATTAAARSTRRTTSRSGRCRSTRARRSVRERAPGAGASGGAESAAGRRWSIASASCRGCKERASARRAGCWRRGNAGSVRSSARSRLRAERARSSASGPRRGRRSTRTSRSTSGSGKVANARRSSWPAAHRPGTRGRGRGR